MATLNFFLPITKSLRTYTWECLNRDLVVGATLATLMIPQVFASTIPAFVGQEVLYVPLLAVLVTRLLRLSK